MVALLAGCAKPQLVPAPEAVRAPDAPGTAAVGTAAGARVVVSADAWDGVPEDLQTVTPIFVKIENGTDVPLRLRYSELVLVSDMGPTFAAVPPFDVEGKEIVQAPPPPYPYAGFHVAPHLDPFYPHLRPFGGRFVYDPFYYDRYYPQLQQVDLPTPDMIRKALPEGVLNAGGRVSGFVYFERVRGGVERVDFLMELVNAKTEQPFAQVRVPFRVP